MRTCPEYDVGTTDWCERENSRKSRGCRWREPGWIRDLLAPSLRARWHPFPEPRQSFAPSFSLFFALIPTWSARCLDLCPRDALPLTPLPPSSSSRPLLRPPSPDLSRQPRRHPTQRSQLPSQLESGQLTLLPLVSLKEFASLPFVLHLAIRRRAAAGAVDKAGSSSVGGSSQTMLRLYTPDGEGGLKV